MFEWDQHSQMQEGAGTVGGSHPSGHDDCKKAKMQEGAAQGGEQDQVKPRHGC